MADNSLRGVWSQVRDFFAPKRNAVREIEKERFPGYYPQQYAYASRGKYYDQYSQHSQITHDLHSRYVDYENMDDYPEIASALDTYADEATTQDIWKKHRLWVEGDNDQIVHDLNFLLHRQLEVDGFQWELVRYLCKYGSNYERMFVNQNGVVATEPLPVALTRRVHDSYGSLVGFIVSRSGDFNLAPKQFYELLQHKRRTDRWQTFYSYVNSVQTFAFEDWEVSHFRLVGKDRLDEYGFAVTDPARWVFRRLIMMEDSALVHRLTRAPSRYVFYVDTGNLPPEQAIHHVQRIKDWYQRQKFVNPKTGKLDMSFNPLAVDEDFFIPVHRERGESVRVDSLIGPDYQSVEDVDYFRRKLGRAIKIPNFGLDNDAQARPLTQEDIKLAAAVMRVQQANIQGWRKICFVHLVATGRSPNDSYWSLHMSPPSAILELARMEVLSAKADVMMRLQEHVSVRWLLTKLFGFSEEEAVNLMVLRQEEIDMVAVAEIEREKQREAMYEGTDMASKSRAVALGANGRAEARLHEKAKRGALGVSPREYDKGRMDISAEKFLTELKSRDKELFNRLSDLREKLHVLNKKMDVSNARSYYR